MIYSLIAVVFILTTVKAGCGIANIDCPSETSCKSGICQPDDIPDIDIPDIDIPGIDNNATHFMCDPANKHTK